MGIGFLFAPQFHASMKHAVGPRKEVGIRSVFNVLGPLTNPACAHTQVVGVYDPALTHPLAEVLARLGVREAYVVHGLERLDEISISGETQVSHLKDGKVATFRIRPEDAGLKPAEPGAVRGGDAQENAEIVRSILRGKPARSETSSCSTPRRRWSSPGSPPISLRGWRWPQRRSTTGEPTTSCRH